MANLITEKYLAPIYGLKKSPRQSVKLDKNILLRSVDLLAEEYKLFVSWGIKVDCDAVFEINYKYNPNDNNEPFPGMFIKVINKLDAALVVYGDGKVGVAAVIPEKKEPIWGGGHLVNGSNSLYEEKLDSELNESFAMWYKNFVKAYDMRPLAFDIFRRSQDRFASSDKTIDSCTILESIFVPKGERGKKSFILNGMKIMGFSVNEVQRIDDLIELRNAIIHADREKILQLYGRAKYISSWFDETFKLVRKILYQYANSPWN